MNDLRHSAYPGQQPPVAFEDLGFTSRLPQVLQNLSEALGGRHEETAIPLTREGLVITGGTEKMLIKLTRSGKEDWAVIRAGPREQEDGPLATGLSLEAVRVFAASIEGEELGGDMTAQVRAVQTPGAEKTKSSLELPKVNLVDVHSANDLEAIDFKPGQMLSVSFVSPYSNQDFALWLASEQSPDSASQADDTGSTFSLVAIRCAGYPNQLERSMATATKLITSPDSLAAAA